MVNRSNFIEIKKVPLVRNTGAQLQVFHLMDRVVQDNMKYLYRCQSPIIMQIIDTTISFLNTSTRLDI